MRRLAATTAARSVRANGIHIYVVSRAPCVVPARARRRSWPRCERERAPLPFAKAGGDGGCAGAGHRRSLPAGDAIVSGLDHILAQGEPDDTFVHAGPVVPPPSAPMAVARQFVEAHFTGSDGPLLLHHRGGFHAWSGTSWPDAEERRVKADRTGPSLSRSSRPGTRFNTPVARPPLRLASGRTEKRAADAQPLGYRNPVGAFGDMRSFCSVSRSSATVA
jgi:hypothetical protein